MSPGTADQLASDAVTLAFCISLGMAAVAIPLLTVQAGHGIGAVGALTALAALTQTFARLGMGRLLEVISTRDFLIGATALMGVTSLMITLSTTLWMFALSQLLQGVARAYFWSGMQTHVVRNAASSVSAVTRMNIVVGVGALLGPVFAGLAGSLSFEFALMLSGVAGILGMIPALFLTSHSPFEVRSKREGGSTSVIRIPGLASAIAMNSVAGSWQALLMSYVPVVLDEAGHHTPAIGALVGLANIATLAGTLGARYLRNSSSSVMTSVALVPTALGIALAALSASNALLAGIFLIISGLGAGLAQTLAPAIAADSVPPEDKGRAMVTIGLFRSLSLLISPLGVWVLLPIMPSVIAATSVGASIWALPALIGFTEKERRASTLA